MDVNPYQPPTVLSPALPSQEAGQSGPTRRPIGIWILSGIHSLAGIFFLIATVSFLHRLRSPDFGTGPLHPLLGYLTVVAGVLSVLGASSGIGMWQGARWGWWLGTFYYVWAVLGVVADFLMALSWFSQMDVQSLAISFAIRLTQLVIHALILAYLFKRNVRAFFQLQSLRIDQALIPLVIIAVILLAASYFVSRSQFAGAF